MQLLQYFGGPNGAAKVGMMPQGHIADVLDFVSPENFGAVGDGIADDTEAVNNALASGRNVKLTAGKTYLVTDTLNMAVNYQYFGGSGVLKLDGVAFVSCDSVTGCDISLNFDSPTHDDGIFALRITNSNRIRVQNCNFIDAGGAIYCEQINTVDISFVWGQVRGPGIKWFGNNALRSDILNVKFVVLACPDTEYAFNWDGNCHTFHCDYFGIVGSMGGIIQATAGDGSFPAIGRFNHIEVDFSKDHSFAVMAGLDYDFCIPYFLGAAKSGLYIDASVNTGQVRLTGGKSRGNTRYGIENLGGPVYWSGNTDLADNHIAETVGEVWTLTKRTVLDDDCYMTLDPAGNPLFVVDPNYYMTFDRATKRWLFIMNGQTGLNITDDVVEVGKVFQLLNDAPVGTGDPAQMMYDPAGWNGAGAPVSSNGDAWRDIVNMESGAEMGTGHAFGSFPNLKRPNVLIKSCAVGHNDIYTVPAGRKALLLDIYVTNPTVSLASYFPEVKQGATYIKYSGINTEGAAGIGHNYALVQTSRQPTMVFLAGEKLSINCDTAGVAFWAVIIEFDDYSPIDRVLFTAFAAGDNIVFTCPNGFSAVQGMNGYLSQNIPQTNMSGMAYFNGSAAMRTIIGPFLVQQGDVAGSSNQVGGTNSPAAGGMFNKFLPMTIGPNAVVVLNTDSNAAGQVFSMVYALVPA